VPDRKVPWSRCRIIGLVVSARFHAHRNAERL
jgi:hypothetical protein